MKRADTIGIGFVVLFVFLGSWLGLRVLAYPYPSLRNYSHLWTAEKLEAAFQACVDETGRVPECCFSQGAGYYKLECSCESEAKP